MPGIPIGVRRTRRIDSLDVEIANTVSDLQAVDRLLPQLVSQMKILMDDTQALQAVVVNTYGPAHLQSTQTDQTFFDLVNVGNDFDKSRSDDYAVSGPVLVGSRRITA